MLIAVSVFALVYNGGIFDGKSFIDAFADTDATVALPWAGLITVVFTIIYLAARNIVSLAESIKDLPKGFFAMVPAILILTFATTLKNITGELGAADYVGNLMAGVPETLAKLLPAIIFLVACVLAFATGTSWGTFGILIPIITAMFEPNNPLFTIGISACLAGAVCGDHCSPISDTTIMSSAGAECEHINHVSTQLPYAIYVAAVSFVCFIIAGFVNVWYIMLPLSIAIMVGCLFATKFIFAKNTPKAENGENGEKTAENLHANNIFCRMHTAGGCSYSTRSQPKVCPDGGRRSLYVLLLVCIRLFLSIHLLVRARTGGQMLITENNACGLYRP